MSKIILASGSRHRADILDRAGVAFLQVPSSLDERAIEAPLKEADVLPEDRAEILAEAKVVDVSEQHTGAFVIGCDQIDQRLAEYGYCHVITSARLTRSSSSTRDNVERLIL